MTVIRVDTEYEVYKLLKLMSPASNIVEYKLDIFVLTSNFHYFSFLVSTFL